MMPSQALVPSFDISKDLNWDEYVSLMHGLFDRYMKRIYAQKKYNRELFVERYVTTVEWDYPTFHLSMRCYLCSVVSGSLTLLEHEAAAWLDRAHLRNVQWLPADEGIIPEIEALLD